MLTQANNREVTIRTLDFGGDKFFEDGRSQKEKNPFLGYRSIRVFLREKGLFQGTASDDPQGECLWQSQDSLPDDFKHRGDPTGPEFI